MIKRLKTANPSKVDIALESLKVGESIPVLGSVSHWRNRQANLHNKNPERWIRIYTTDRGYVAERIS